MRKHQAIINQVICLWLTLLLTGSCQNNTIYHSYQPVDSTGWHKSDTLIYPLPQALPNETYPCEIGIRHLDNYKYRDIWLTVNQDTLHLYLADSIGNWKGNGIGNMRQQVYPVQLQSFTGDSIREFRITHIMQDNPLKGIHHIGIRIQSLP